MSQEQEPEIRVKDRRMFNSDGSLRTPDPNDEPRDVATEPAVLKVVEAAPAPVAPMPEPEVLEDEELDADAVPLRPGEPSMFSDFVMNLASQAAMYMGLVDNPLGPRLPVDMGAARQMLDILGMMREKTRGNLTAEENLLLERILTDLRMQYVSLAATRR